MITITLKGPPGTGKTRIVNNLRDLLDTMGLTHVLTEEATTKAIDILKPDVVIIEETTK